MNKFNEEEAYNFIISGKNRIKIYLTLLNGGMFINDIAIETDTNISSISRTVKELVKKNIIIANKINSSRTIYKLEDFFLSDVFKSKIINIARIRGLIFEERLT